VIRNHDSLHLLEDLRGRRAKKKIYHRGSGGAAEGAENSEQDQEAREAKEAVRLEMKQIGVWGILGLWGLVCAGAVGYAMWQGYRGPAFAAAVGAFVVLLLGMLLFAAKGVERAFAGFGAGGGFLLGAGVLVVYVIYLAGSGGFSLARAGVMAALVFAPLGVAASTGRAAAGAWQDFLVVAGVWAFVKFGPSHWLWPYPGGKLAYVMTVLVAVNVAVATFLVVRGTNGVGYSIGWGKNWGWYVAGSFAAFGCVAIPLGMGMRFIAFAPQWNRWSSLLFTSVAILFFTAGPEELLFRGLLQNFLVRASKNELAGWWTASVFFGLSHITNMEFPNWRYVILAAIAGIFYGWTWRKTGSIFASAVVHAGVDTVWHFLFRTG
jgi:membrane protease YdiL (CAAX protease family)